MSIKINYFFAIQMHFLLTINEILVITNRLISLATSDFYG